MNAPAVSLEEALNVRVWRTKRELARIMRTSTREVEAMVEAARKAGSLPIMSGALGYRLASTPEEYAANVDSRRRRAIGQLVTVRGERGHLRRWRDRKVSQGMMPWA